MKILKSLLALCLIVSVYNVRAQDDWADDTGMESTETEASEPAEIVDPSADTSMEEPAAPAEESMEEPAAPVVKEEAKKPEPVKAKAQPPKGKKAKMKAAKAKAKTKAKGKRLAKGKHKNKKPAKAKDGKDASNTTM
jgi:hypothetical protein